MLVIREEYHLHIQQLYKGLDCRGPQTTASGPHADHQKHLSSLPGVFAAAVCIGIIHSFFLNYSLALQWSEGQ